MNKNEVVRFLNEKFFDKENLDCEYCEFFFEKDDLINQFYDEDYNEYIDFAIRVHDKDEKSNLYVAFGSFLNYIKQEREHCNEEYI